MHQYVKSVQCVDDELLSAKDLRGGGATASEGRAVNPAGMKKGDLYGKIGKATTLSIPKDGAGSQ